MERPLVSVIIPAHNTAQYIAETLDSVLAQSFRSFEVLVVNDGSPDSEELQRVLEPYRQRIAYLVQDNRGPGAARNLGIQHARGEFLAFLDSDDVWRPAYLAEQLRAFENDPDLDLIYCDFEFFGDTASAGKTFVQLYPPKSEAVNLQTLVTGDCPTIYPSCALVKRQVIVDAGAFDETFWSYGEDFDLWLRVAYRGGKLAFQKKVLAARRSWSGSSNTARLRVANGYLSVLRKLQKNAALSSDLRLAIDRNLVQAQAAIHVWNGKRQFANGEYQAAKASFSEANNCLHSKKLTLVVLALRLMPKLAGLVARTWHRLHALALTPARPKTGV